MKIDFAKFAGTAPYASEMYGTYQPLLGWKSALQTRRLSSGLQTAKSSYLSDLSRRLKARYSIASSVNDAPRYQVTPADLGGSAESVGGLDSIVGRRVYASIVAAGADDPSVWHKYTTPEYLTELLGDIHPDVKAELLRTTSGRQIDPDAALSRILQRESVAAGALSYLNRQHDPNNLKIVLAPGFVEKIPLILSILDPAQGDMARAALSPIGTVHLFREYFFEFDTFLGPPVQHVWLSPGGTVELVEISTRKTLVERTIEQSMDTTTKSDKDSTTQDELSDAVREENSSDTKLGVTANSTNSYTVGIVSGSVSVSGSYNLEQQQKQAREQTHKSMRQQTEKLSTEIRKSYKSTFKTTTETIDTTSKRYVLQNTTPDLLNYELRRKFRQVGVQVQDYGTRLCWQAYVDLPGDGLGVASFVHVGELPDLQSIKQPISVPMPDPIVRGQALSMKNLHWRMPDVNFHDFVPLCAPVSIVPPAGYVVDHVEAVIQSGVGWDIHAWPKGPNDAKVDVVGSIDVVDGILSFEGPPVSIDARPDFIKDIDAGDGTTEPSVVKVYVGVQPGPGGLQDDQPYDWAVEVTPFFKPSQANLKQIVAANKASQDKNTEEISHAFQEALFKTARDRVTLASKIQQRPFSDLREEERIVVYRGLVGQLLAVAGITTEDAHLRHVFSEVVASMFDLENMLYFVAPDWWMPRRQATAASTLEGVGIGTVAAPGAPTPQQVFAQADVVSWGGGKANRVDNYYITEDSTTAKLGASLGWLLQLDGDNFRNAFLNAPWVKAVIPLRAGHEWSALGWLTSAHIEGSDGLSDVYQEAASGEKAGMLDKLKAYSWSDSSLASRYAAIGSDDVTILDAIRYLIISIQAKQITEGTKDPVTGYLPTDQVYEHGFDPLLGGFVAQPGDQVPFQIFDQWVEILPTDQIVPVQVSYNPKTGMQI